MASTLRPPALLLSASPDGLASLPKNPRNRVLCFSSKKGFVRPLRFKLSPFASRPLGWPKLRTFAASGDATKAEEVEDTATKENVDESIPVEDGATDGNVLNTELNSTLTPLLQSYKEALLNDDESRIAEIEDFLQSFEDEKNNLADKVAGLSQVLSAEKDRVLRISADFDNFRKRTERERLSLMENVQGEVIESLLPVLDNFERAKAQIKVETEGEEKINNSYQSIYKQFLEILTSLGVETVETVGVAFDPMLHEAIMREESTEYEEGIIIQEFRKGFKLGDRLLRPSMVKVSAGPGPEKPADDDALVQHDNEANEVIEMQHDNEANEVIEEADDDAE